jgi:hypothetical protein
MGLSWPTRSGRKGRVGGESRSTKATHKPIRDQFKACALAVQHGRGGTGPADRVAVNPRARFAAQAPRDLPSFLAVRCGYRSHYADGQPAHMLTSSLPTVFEWNH